MVHKDEIYNFICGKFKVYELYQWAKENVELASVSLDEVAKHYGFIGDENKSLFRLDKEYAKKLSIEDVLQPLLFVDLGEGGCLMIDGTHRAYHMWLKGTIEASAYVIKNDDIILEHSSMPKKMLEHLRA